MKSPRFDARSGILRKIFSPGNLERVWKDKVRTSMREQYINDGIENFDFHIARNQECKNLSRLILKGNYIPDKAQRILVEKSKGLCRQLVIPTARDALVLQCLSDSLYKNIKDKAPTKQAFFEPKDHRFSLTKITSSASGYGTYASWINFQRALFNFSKERKFVVATDISNYYDSISYTHLRNVIAPIAGVEECVLDMLIYVLGSLLWQPDYMPVVEIGLPQINLDAPRLLAHCFLYELDAFLASDPNRDFVRFMDDIDIGVDSLADAKKILKSVDLVLQTRQVRLNSGKTLILKQADALRHFRIRENARLDMLKARLERKRKAGAPMRLEVRLIELRIRRGLSNGAFDDGNGEKILKRWIGLAASVGAVIQPKQLQRLFLLRPTIRSAVCAYVRQFDLTPGRAKALALVAESGLIVDDAALVDLANHLVETAVTTTHKRHTYLSSIISSLDTSTYYGLYCKLWLQSKYDTRENLLETIRSTRETWVLHERLGRVIGAFVPIFTDAPEWNAYFREISNSRNHGIRDAYKFHINLSSNPNVFSSMFPALSNPNKSRGTGITHAKFLALLSALKNRDAPPAQIDTLRKRNAAAWRDIYYRGQARRLGINVAP
ncbi:MAG: RNA-directed DNA polymerase [Caenispirillum sp.]|nr:RNA-directed DNA polymerase [Caenispirillum sp.]